MKVLQSNSLITFNNVSVPVTLVKKYFSGYISLSCTDFRPAKWITFVGLYFAKIFLNFLSSVTVEEKWTIFLPVNFSNWQITDKLLFNK